MPAMPAPPGFKTRTRARSELALATKRAKNHPSPEAEQQLIEAQREMAVANIAAFIKHVTDTAPSLTSAQRTRIVKIIKGS